MQISSCTLPSLPPHPSPLRRDDFGLKDVNMGVDMGSRIAIVGPNGAGKVSLSRIWGRGRGEW